MVGALTLLVGGLFLFNRVFLQKIHTWHWATEYFKSRMVDLGLAAGAALAIGLGLLPVVCGFVALRLPDRRGEPAYRAFAAFLAASIVVFSLYTAGKAAYLSTVFSTLTEERNLIYLSPLLLVATVLVFESRRIDWRIAIAATAFVALHRADEAVPARLPVLRGAGRVDPHGGEPAPGVGHAAPAPRAPRRGARRARPARGAARARRRGGGDRAAARVDARRRDHGDRGRRQHREQLPQPPRAAARPDRPVDGPAAGDVHRPGVHRPERALADGVLEPLAPARREPRLDRRPGPGRRSGRT